MNNQTTLQYKWSNKVTYGTSGSHGAVAQLDDTGRGMSGNIRHPEGCLWKNNNNNAQQENNDKTKTVALQTIDTPRPRNIANDGHPEVVTLDVEDMEQDAQRSLLEDGLEDEALDSDGQIDEFQCRHCGIHKEVDDEIWYACPYAVFHGYSQRVDALNKI